MRVCHDELSLFPVSRLLHVIDVL